jgi:transposase-like protein
VLHDRMESMEKTPQWRCGRVTPEFKPKIVELYKRKGRLVCQVVKDFDLTETVVGKWVRQAEREERKSPNDLGWSQDKRASTSSSNVISAMATIGVCRSPHERIARWRRRLRSLQELVRLL